MVDLRSYFPQSVHEDMSIKTKVLFAWPKVGEGKFDSIEEDFINFSGAGKVVTYDFDVSIKVQIRTSSTCGVNFNGNDMDAQYEGIGDELVFQINSGPTQGKIAVYEDSGGTTIEANISGGHTIWIGP